jgi:hypothetical protein
MKATIAGMEVELGCFTVLVNDHEEADRVLKHLHQRDGCKFTGIMALGYFGIEGKPLRTAIDFQDRMAELTPAIIKETTA